MGQLFYPWFICLPSHFFRLFFRLKRNNWRKDTKPLRRKWMVCEPSAGAWWKPCLPRWLNSIHLEVFRSIDWLIEEFVLVCSMLAVLFIISNLSFFAFARREIYVCQPQRRIWVRRVGVCCRPRGCCGNGKTPSQMTSTGWRMSIKITR